MSWYILIPFVFIFVAFVLKMPIGWGMFLGCIVYFLTKGIGLNVVMNSSAYGIYNSYILIAVPLFIFTANVMNESAVTDRIFKFANGVVGRFRGGTAYVNILASLIFAGMTGSAIADASGLGKIEIAQMKEDGYDLPFSCAITATTSVIGPIFPPSLPFIVFAMLSGASVGKMFMGGIVPALLLAVSLGIYVYFIAKKRNYPRGEKVTLRQFCIDTVKAIPALLTPVILLIGIYTGIMTPTEAGAVAAAYTMLISFFVYRTLDWSAVKRIFLDTLNSCGSIFLLVAAAFCFSYIISLEQVAPWLSTVLGPFVKNKYLFLLVVNIIFIILGALIDVNVTQLVFVPIFIPLAKMLGIDMVHFGVMICLNMMIGLATPPFGMLLFITSSVGKCSLKDIVKETLPMLIPMFIVLFLITYVPTLITFIPDLLS